MLFQSRNRESSYFNGIRHDGTWTTKLSCQFQSRNRESSYFNGANAVSLGGELADQRFNLVIENLIFSSSKDYSTSSLTERGGTQNQIILVSNLVHRESYRFQVLKTYDGDSCRKMSPCFNLVNQRIALHAQFSRCSSRKGARHVPPNQ